MGYAPSLVRPNDTKPTHDFGFYGSLTRRRLSILKRLAKYANNPLAVRLVSDFKTQTERDTAMRQAKVVVQLRKFDRMGLVSSSRCNTALCLGRPVVAEPHDLSKPWDEIVTFTQPMEQFFSMCLFMRATWRSKHEAQMERFKTLLSPDNCVGQAFRKIGIFQAVAA